MPRSQLSPLLYLYPDSNPCWPETDLHKENIINHYFYSELASNTHTFLKQDSVLNYHKWCWKYFFHVCISYVCIIASTILASIHIYSWYNFLIKVKAEVCSYYNLMLMVLQEESIWNSARFQNEPSRVMSTDTIQICRGCLFPDSWILWSYMSWSSIAISCPAAMHSLRLQKTPFLQKVLMNFTFMKIFWCHNWKYHAF